MSEYRNIFQSSSTERTKRFYRYFVADRALGAFGINAIVEALPETSALDLARESDQRHARNEALSPIDGAVVTVKDTASLPVAGFATTYGSNLWSHEVDGVDAPAVARLRQAGCVIVGRTTAPEFGWKATTSSPRFNVTRSAIDLTRTSGGSSGGAASSVAAGMADVGLGTDAGGSVRIPAAIQGIVGFKPSRGLIKSPYSSELSGPGLIARSVNLVAAAFHVLTASVQPIALTTDQSSLSGKGLRFAYSRNLGGLAEPNAEIEEIVGRVLDEVVRRHLASEVEEAEPSLNTSAVWECGLTFYLIKLALLMSTLQLSPDSTELDPGLRVLMASPVFRTASDRLEWARSQRHDAQQSISKFQLDNRYDLIVTPTLGREPDLAASCEEDYRDAGRPFWETPTNVASHTYLFNLTGQPALTVPCGFTQSGQPVGLQFIGQVGSDALVLEVANAFERVLKTARGIPQVILINGPSSAGKSTLARKVAAELAQSPKFSDLRLVSFDDFAAKGMAPRHWSKQFVRVAGNADMLEGCLGPEAWWYDDQRTAPHSPVSLEDPPSCALALTDLGLAYLSATFQRWATMLRCGISLVIDHYLMNPNWYWEMKERFGDVVYQQTSVGLFCDSEVLQVREALRSQLEARVCGTANFSADRVHEVFRTATGSDYDLKFRSDTPVEQRWARDEYENVVLTNLAPKAAKPPSSETELALKVVEALESFRGTE